MLIGDKNNSSNVKTSEGGLYRLQCFRRVWHQHYLEHKDYLPKEHLLSMPGIQGQNY